MTRTRLILGHSSLAFLIYKVLLLSPQPLSVDGNQDSRDSSQSASIPEFTSPSRNLTAAVGREASFPCSVSNIGRYKVGWLRDSDKMIISLHTRTVIQNDRISVRFEPLNMVAAENLELDHKSMEDKRTFPANVTNGTWWLILRQLKESDQGCYMCQINTSPMISQKGCLEVLVSPDILNGETSTDVSVIEGENATLTCRARGKPEPRISWKRENGNPILIRSSSNGNLRQVMTFNGSSIVLHKIDRKQMGTYLCIANNDVHPAVSKRVTLSVNFLPSVQALNQLLGAPFGTDVVLECYVEAHPSTVNYWFKNPSKMLLEGSKYSIDEHRDGYKVSLRLTIRHFRADDIGSYRCISSNSLGRVEGVSRLYRIGDSSEQSSTHRNRQTLVIKGFADSISGSGSRMSMEIAVIVQLMVLQAISTVIGCE